MEMTGEQRIAAPREAVWAALNDPDVLKACIPGCESIDKQSDTDYKIVMLAAVGPVKARFTGKLAIEDSDPPQGYALVFEGSGGAAGFGKGRAAVALSGDEPDATLLSYTASAQVSGKLAQVGSRLIDGVARKMAGDFFGRFNARFAEDGGQDGAPGDAEAGAQAGTTSGTATGAAGFAAAGAAAPAPGGSSAAAPASAAATAPRPASSAATLAARAPAADNATAWKIATAVLAVVACAALAYAFSVS